MTFGTSSSGISFSGLASGIDSHSVVRQLMALERRPVERLQTQQAQLRQRQSVYGQLRSHLVALNGASSRLTQPSTYDTMRSTVSREDVLGVSVGSGARAGRYSIRVDSLAQMHRVSSGAQATAREPLGLAGTLSVNGRLVEINAGQSLTEVAAGINSAAAGVTASVIDGGRGRAFLTLSSGRSGTEGRIHLGGSSSVLEGLGLASGPAAVRRTNDQGWALSLGFAQPDQTLASLMGRPMSGSVTVGGRTITVNTAEDTLQSIAAKLAGTGAKAEVQIHTSDGRSTHQLAVQGPFHDPDGILEALGVLQRPLQNVLIEARDAAFTVDGVALTSSSNEVRDVIPGVTLTLRKAGDEAQLDLSRDTQSVKSAFTDFMHAFNRLRTFIREASTFDSETFRTGPLFGDPVAAQLDNSLSRVLFNSVGSGALRNLTQVGFSFDKEGMLTLDEPILDRAIAEQPDALRQLMSSSGSVTDPRLSFVAGSERTAPSELGYEVLVTRAARAAERRGTPLFDPLDRGETLTFRGALFGQNQVVLAIGQGLTLAQVADRINADPRLRTLVAADVEDGALVVRSRQEGASRNFTLTSDRTDPGGLGLGADLGTYLEGLDIEGTIGGEPALGHGRTLTGKSGNPNTEGLQVIVNSDQLGAMGRVAYRKGVGSQTSRSIGVLLDSVGGVLSTHDRSILAQIADIDRSIASLEERLVSREAILRARFTAMERAVSELQGQMTRLEAIAPNQQNNR